MRPCDLGFGTPYAVSFLDMDLKYTSSFFTLLFRYG